MAEEEEKLPDTISIRVTSELHKRFEAAPRWIRVKIAEKLRRTLSQLLDQESVPSP